MSGAASRSAPLVAVVIPARDEEATIAACLVSVLAAMAAAAVLGPVVVVAHRCTDATAVIAARVLGERGWVIEDDSDHVSGVRLQGTEVALDLLAPGEREAWLLSTDADSTVPLNWVLSILGHAARGADAVAGLVELESWHGMGPAGRRAYRELVAAGIDGMTHHHAYAANLAVTVQAYREVGGWPQVPVGEEHALLAVLEQAGRSVLRCTDIVVTTSGRQRGRAAGGLGDLLADLDASHHETTASFALRALNDEKPESNGIQTPRSPSVTG